MECYIVNECGLHHTTVDGVFLDKEEAIKHAIDMNLLALKAKLNIDYRIRPMTLRVGKFKVELNNALSNGAQNRPIE